MFLSKCAILLPSLFTLGVMVTPACSTTITTYTDLASWQAATSGDQTDNFEGLTTPGGVTVFSPAAIVQNGVEFIGLAGNTAGVGDTSSGFFSSFANFGTVQAVFDNAGGSAGGITITLPSPVTAVSMNLFTAPGGMTYTVTIPSATPITVPTFSTPTPAFIGLTSDTAFNTITLQFPAGTNYGFLDNFSWGTAQAMDPVPEAGTFLLISSGLVGFAGFRRWRQPR